MLFALIGAIGLVVHILVLSAFRVWLGTPDFQTAQVAATLVADGEQLRPQQRDHLSHPSLSRACAMIGGFAAFAARCSVGALANIDVASWLYRSNQTWWVSGLSGAALSVVWNYAVSSNLIWRPSRRG